MGHLYAKGQWLRFPYPAFRSYSLARLPVASLPDYLQRQAARFAG